MFKNRIFTNVCKYVGVMKIKNILFNIMTRKVSSL